MENLKPRLLHRIRKNLNMLHNCTKFAVNYGEVNSSHKENKCKPFKLVKLSFGVNGA